jgi:hypothetical protein
VCDNIRPRSQRQQVLREIASLLRVQLQIEIHCCNTGQEIGIDTFQTDRAPDHRYRTSPLKGLWNHQKGGFYHDGRFPTLLSVVDHVRIRESKRSTTGCRFGASATIAPTLRSRFAQPSSRWSMLAADIPGALNEASTVEWQSEHARKSQPRHR